MKKDFVAPVLRREETLAQLTLSLCVSGPNNPPGCFFPPP